MGEGLLWQQLLAHHPGGHVPASRRRDWTVEGAGRADVRAAPVSPVLPEALRQHARGVHHPCLASFSIATPAWDATRSAWPSLAAAGPAARSRPVSRTCTRRCARKATPGWTFCCWTATESVIPTASGSPSADRKSVV